MTAYIKNLAVILSKAQGVIDADTAQPIDIGAEVLAIRQECDAFRASIAALEAALTSKVVDKVEVCMQLSAAEARVEELEALLVESQSVRRAT